MKSGTYPAATRARTFRNRYHSVAIAGCSVAAVAGLAAYLGAGGSPALSASYHPSTHPLVEGIVKVGGTAVAGARVQVRFLEPKHHVVRVCVRTRGHKRCHPRTISRGSLRWGPWVERHTERAGHWVVVSHPLAKRVRIAIGVAGERVGGTFALPTHASLTTTAVFPSRGSGLLPAIFPY